MRLPALTVAAVALQRRKPSTSMLLVRHLGGIALVPLGILDSSIIPTFGSLDLLTAWLAAGTPYLWFYYAAMSTAGSVVGAILTYRLGIRMGREWIQKKIGPKKYQRIGDFIER